jgi:hypothetical protein
MGPPSRFGQGTGSHPDSVRTYRSLFFRHALPFPRYMSAHLQFEKGPHLPDNFSLGRRLRPSARCLGAKIDMNSNRYTKLKELPGSHSKQRIGTNPNRYIERGYLVPRLESSGLVLSTRPAPPTGQTPQRLPVPTVGTSVRIRSGTRGGIVVLLRPPQPGRTSSVSIIPCKEQA